MGDIRMRVTRVTTAAAAELTANDRRERCYVRWFAVFIALLIAAVIALQWQNRRNERAEVALAICAAILDLVNSARG
jgi:hypothetical protein